LLALLLLLSCSYWTIQAATITVDKTADEADGSCSDGDCSLRDAITVANGNGEADIITIPDGTYTLTLGTELTISSDITLQGTSQSSTIIEAHTTKGSATHRVFQVTTSGTDVTFENMTIRHGVSSSSGGGVLINLGSFSTGTATFTNVTISDNQTTGSTAGGGLFIEEDITTVTMTGCIIHGNSSENGGGLLQGGAATFSMTNSAVYENTASALGGGVLINESGSTNTLTNCTIRDNQAGGGNFENGGGVFLSSGNHNLFNCTIINNTNAYEGGGIYDGTTSNNVNIYHCTIANNSASVNGGGVRLTNSTGTQNIYNSIVADNTAPTGADINIAAGSITNASDADHSVVESCNGTCPSSPSFVSTDPSLGSETSCSNTNLKFIQISAGSSAENIGTTGGSIPTGHICGGTGIRDGSTPDAGSYEIGAPLPVELYAFKCEVTTNGNVLTWLTVSELNNEGFDIERSIDGREWQTIGFVEGHGTSQEINHYIFTDEVPLAGMNYYRLKQMDFNGKFEYSYIVNVELQLNNDELRIFPNPVSDELNIVNGAGLATIYNILGQPVKEFLIPNAQFLIHTTDLPKGQYILRITQENGTVMTKQFIR
jgi:CSLREA domain-containing protein